jgi:aspartyl-tRNA(Asn)/glutamyl-tRNA(Gln) amidotransferase subunit C
MSISREDVLRVASLARIAIPPERLDALAAELGGILDHMAVLSNVDAASATAQQSAMPLADDVGPSVALDRPRESFGPKMRDGFFLVPRLHTHDDAGAESA